MAKKELDYYVMIHSGVNLTSTTQCGVEIIIDNHFKYMLISIK